MLNSHRLHHRMEVDVLRARPRHRRLCCIKSNVCMLTIRHPHHPTRLGVAPPCRFLAHQSSPELHPSGHQSHVFVLSISLLKLTLVHRLQHRARCLHTRQPTKHVPNLPSRSQNTTPSLRFSTKTSSPTLPPTHAVPSPTHAISVLPALRHLRPQPSTPTSQKPTSPHPALQAL